MHLKTIKARDSIYVFETRKVTHFRKFPLIKVIEIDERNENFISNQHQIKSD